MKSPEIIEQPEMILAGIVATGEKVTDIDIGGLWQQYLDIDADIANKVNPDKGYELHIHLDGNPERHVTLIGVMVSKLAAIPETLFAKMLPAGKYALFTHHFSEGSYGDAFQAVYAWLEESQYRSAHPFDIQVYDERFKGPENPDSVLEILIPVEEK
jgi:AraC family transcriptional regulator